MSTMRRFGMAVLMLVATTLPGWARVWYVNAASTQAPADGSSFAHGFHAIQDAVSAAADGDEVWVAKGTYTDHVTVLPRAVSFYGGFAGTETARAAADPAANPTIWDGGNQHPSILTLFNASTVDGFTFQNGRGTYVSTDNAYEGGALLIGFTAKVTVSRCTFRDNDLTVEAATHPGFGGAMEVYGSATVTVRGCVFQDNAAYQGGAVSVGEAKVAIDASPFNGNKATLGGGLYDGTNGAATLYGCAFTGNTATTGGGVYVADAVNGFLLGGTFSGNTASFGGGCYTAGSAYTEVLCNTFTGNVSSPGSGGGIYVDATPRGSTVVGSNAFLRNTASGANPHGGAIAVYSGAVVNNTVVGSTGDGIFVNGASAVSNNIVTQSTGGGIASPSASTALANNDCWGNTGPNYPDGNAPPASNLSADPVFHNLAGDDIRLEPASPCRDAGTTGAARLYDIFSDLEGQPRVYGPSVDIGADEVAPYLVFTDVPTRTRIGYPLTPAPAIRVVDIDGALQTGYNASLHITVASGPTYQIAGTTTADAVNGVAAFPGLSLGTFGAYTLQVSETVAGLASAPSPPVDVLLGRCYVKPAGDDTLLGDTWDTARQTLASALAATAGPDGEVWVAAGTYNGNLTVPDGVTLYGGFSGTETSRDQRNPYRTVKTSVIKGNGAAQCVRFVNSSGNGIDNFRLTGGIGFPVQKIGTTAHREGGAIYVESASPTITNCLITGNSALYGGGISVEGGHPDIRYNTIAQNAAVASGPLLGAGGGIALTGGTLADNVIVLNTASGASASGTPSVGGGLLVSGTADVHNNTIVGNESPPGQGDVYITGSPAFSNNIIRNRAGIEKASGSPRFSHNDYVRGLAVVDPLPDPTGTNGNVNTAPEFVNEAQGDYHLAAGSALIDAGDNAAVLAGETDVDGQSRIDNGTVDIGADEVAPALYGVADVTESLGAAGGLRALASTDGARLDIQSPTGVDVSDAVRIARKAAGLEANP